MLNTKLRIVLTVLFSLAVVGCLQEVSMEQKVPRMSVQELRAMLGQPDLVVLDVRIKDEWEKSDSKIKGAVRENPEVAIRSWAENYPRNKTLVFYCD